MIINFRCVLVAVFCVISLCKSQQLPAVEFDSTETSSSSIKWIATDATGAVAVTLILFHYDQQIYNGLYSWKMNNEIVKDVSPVITNLGNGLFSAGLFGGFAGYGLIFKDTKAFETGKIGMESFLFTGVAVQFFKYMFSRQRPSAATRPGGVWYGPFAYFSKSKGSGKGLSSFDSFPSGHTTTVFAAATTISDFYTEPWVSYLCYTLATGTAVSRVTESTHWMSDCFVGAILGYYGTKIVEKINYGSSDVSILPQADGRQYGFLLSVKF